MAEAAIPAQIDSVAAGEQAQSRSRSTFARVARYTLFRVISLFITVVIGVYLTILIANFGGHMDVIRRAQIEEAVTLFVSQDPRIRDLSPEERENFMQGQIESAERRLGLDQPFAIRSVTYLANALTMDFGLAEQLHSDSGSKMVRNILLERLPATLVLFGTQNMLLFFGSIFAALALSRRYGSFWDKLIVAFTPTSSAPAWFYGIFLIVIFAGVLGWLPYGGMMDAEVPDNPFIYALKLGRHLILPVTALLISGVALTVYTWRTFFLIYSSEDYVELAKAKGLPDRLIERRYILRPTLPTIITTFALTIIGMWQGAIVLETVFNWPGLGRTFFNAIGATDTPVIVAETVIFAYLLALTVFLLDFIYALVDPRVKIGDEGKKL